MSFRLGAMFFIDRITNYFFVSRIANINVLLSLVILLSEFRVMFPADNVTDRLIPVHLILPIAFEHRAYTLKLVPYLHGTNT